MNQMLLTLLLFQLLFIIYCLFLLFIVCCCRCCCCCIRTLVNLGENYFTLQSAHGGWLYSDIFGQVRCSKQVVDGWQVWEMEKRHNNTYVCC